MLCFAVYSAGLAFNRIYRRELDRLGLTYPQYLVMLALWARDGQAIGQLGEALSLETNTLTPMLKRLQAMGLIERVRDSRDERRVVVSLTPRGRQIEAEAAGITRCIAAATGLGGDDLAALAGKLQELARSLDRAARAQD